MLHNKNELLDGFKVFKVEIQKQRRKQIKVMRFNKDEEYYGRYTQDDKYLVYL